MYITSPDKTGQRLTMKRIAVIGKTGSGKTIMARHIAARLDYPHIELDAIHWLPGWQELPLDRFRAEVAGLVKGVTWIADGNYSQVRDIVWLRADTIVWLDYPTWIVLPRLLWRTLKHLVLNEELWAGNRQQLRMLLSRDSIFRWLLVHQRDFETQIQALLNQPQHTHLTLVRLTTPKAARQFLDLLQS